MTRLRDKVKYLAQAGVDYLLCVTFDASFAANDANTFISSLLVEKLGVKFLVVGMTSASGLAGKGISCYYRKQAPSRILR